MGVNKNKVGTCKCVDYSKKKIVIILSKKKQKKIMKI